MTTGRLPSLRVEQLDPMQLALYEQIAGGRRASGPQHFRLRHDDGSLTGPFNALLHAPTVGGRVSALGEAVRFETAFTDREREIAILAVAAARDAAYEQYAHEALGRARGLTDDELAGIRRGDVVLDDERERLVHDVAATLAAGRALDDVAYEAAAVSLGDTTLVELVVLVGYYGLLATVLDAFAIGVPEGDAP